MCLHDLLKTPHLYLTTRYCFSPQYVRLSCDAKPEELRSLLLREWNMTKPKLLISVHGGTDNFPLPPRVSQAFSKGLIRAAETAGAWIFTDGLNTGVWVLVCPSYFHLWVDVFGFILCSLYLGVSMYVGDAVKTYGTHERRKRAVIGITPWGLVENQSCLIGQDVSFLQSHNYLITIMLGDDDNWNSIR